MKNIFIVIGTLLLSMTSAYATKKKVIEKSFDAKEIERLELEAVISKVDIIGTTDKKATVIATINQQNEKKCTLEIKKSGKYLMVDIDWKDKNKSINIDTDDKKKDKRDASDECDIDFQVMVPINTDIDVKYISGLTSIKNIKGDIELNKVEGNTDIEGEGGELELNVVSSDTKLSGKFSRIRMKSASGDISFNGNCADTTLNLASGDTTIKFDKVIDKGELRIRAISGDTNIYMPKGMKIETDYVSMSGDLKNYIGDSKKADFKIYVKSISGSVKIDKL